jgi:GNAT superfamily N-acetyltransferase
LPIEILPADLDDPAHCAGVVDVLDSYASDPIGGGTPLSPDVRQRLIPGLRDHPTTFILLAFRDGRAVGVLVGFFGFSTFQARPLLNIHDLAIIPECRGQGIGRQLLSVLPAGVKNLWTPSGRGRRSRGVGGCLAVSGRRHAISWNRWRVIATVMP